MDDDSGVELLNGAQPSPSDEVSSGSDSDNMREEAAARFQRMQRRSGEEKTADMEEVAPWCSEGDNDSEEVDVDVEFGSDGCEFEDAPDIDHIGGDSSDGSDGDEVHVFDLLHSSSDESDEEGDEKPIASPGVLMAYTGHINRSTVKSVNFFGPHDEFVVSGSDCGNIFIWDTRTARLVTRFHGDEAVVNCITGHPYDLVLASSGIENDVKLFRPGERSEEQELEDAGPIRGDGVERASLAVWSAMERALRRSGAQENVPMRDVIRSLLRDL